MSQEQMAHRYTLGPDEAPSNGVYTAVAEMEACSPLDLTPLAETIDPDALDTILTDHAQKHGIQTTFHYCQYEVVASPGEIHVQTPETDHS